MRSKSQLLVVPRPVLSSSRAHSINSHERNLPREAINMLTAPSCARWHDYFFPLWRSTSTFSWCQHRSLVHFLCAICVGPMSPCKAFCAFTYIWTREWQAFSHSFCPREVSLGSSDAREKCIESTHLINIEPLVNLSDVFRLIDREIWTWRAQLAHMCGRGQSRLLL